MHPICYCNMHRSAWDNTDGNCAIASYTFRYTYFFGNTSANMFTKAFYDQTDTDNGPYGWIVRECSNSNQFMCKIAATAFPCNPPPSPAPPPPEPPSPPSPPRLASCELPWQCAASAAAWAAVQLSVYFHALPHHNALGRS
jgi:hypothetical protein